MLGCRLTKKFWFPFSFSFLSFTQELEGEEQEFLSLRKGAREEMHAVAGSVQRMTIVQKTNEQKMSTMIEKLETMDKQVARRKKEIRRVRH